jgi:protein with PEP-CTERM/exosortase system signal
MKNLTKTILTLIAAGLVLTALSTQEAQAAKITGRLDIAGSVMFDSSALQNVNQVNQWRDINGNIGFSNVAAFNGSYVGFVNLGDQATMATPWIFGPATSGLWNVDGFTFDLLGSTVVTQNAQFLDIRGTGIISGNGFDPTASNWAWTIQNAGGNRLFFSFSANNSTQVPDGGSTVALLGIGLGAIEFIRRKIRHRA